MKKEEKMVQLNTCMSPLKIKMGNKLDSASDLQKQATTRKKRDKKSKEVSWVGRESKNGYFGLP